jgi:16S rRNA U1498 N3-methylase RsmE
VIAVAPPASKDRQRFLVEKLAELGVMRLRWLRTKHGEGRPASPPKVFAWGLAAVEQSRGAWLMEIDPMMVGWEDLEGPIAVCDRGGTPGRIHARTVVIGPEGGLDPEEIPEGSIHWKLNRNVLRVETAAVVASAMFLAD